MYRSDFQDISTGRYFGLTTHPTSEDAEAYAVAKLLEFGETESDPRSAARMVGRTCADASAHGYAVRIFDADEG